MGKVPNPGGTYPPHAWGEMGGAWNLARRRGDPAPRSQFVSEE